MDYESTLNSWNKAGIYVYMCIYIYIYIGHIFEEGNFNNKWS